MLEINYAWAFKLWNKSQKNMKTIIPHIYFGRGPPCPNSKDATPQERLVRSWWGVWLNTPRDGQMGEMRWMTIFLPVITIVTTWMPWETITLKPFIPNPRLYQTPRWINIELQTSPKVLHWKRSCQEKIATQEIDLSEGLIEPRIWI